jgi:3-hydroxyisobutyrate dehydrogenase-like beta-hydroxyacid dehydrogenase
MFKIGICGIGKMGSEITKRLIECNQTVSIWNRTKGKMEELKKIGAIVTEEIKELFVVVRAFIIQNQLNFS